MTTEYQTRSETNGLKTLDSWDDAIQAAVMDPTIWKVSYNDVRNNRVRLIRDETGGLFKREDMVTSE